MIDMLNMDCYEHIKTIKDKSVDLIITDPPYIMPTMAQGEVNKKTFKDITHWDTIDKNKTLRKGFDLSLLDEFWRIQPFLNAYIFCNAKLLQVLMAYYLNKGFSNIEVLVLYKTNPIPAFNLHYLPDMEYILYVCEDKSSLNLEFKSASKLFSVSIPFEKFTKHPTEKPLWVIEQLIKNSSKDEALIYDPFLGGGTTAHACKFLNRNFIGTEISSEYYNEALNRLKYKAIGRLFYD